jgi:hypothetical protein
MMPVRCPPLKTLTAVAVLFLLPWSTALRAADPVPAAAASVADSTPVELPKFRFGLWEFSRTQLRADLAKPHASTIRKCADPGADMREKMETLKKKDCQFAPIKHRNDRYISTWVCQTPTGAMRFRDILLAKDENSYEDVSETRTAQHVARQKLEARRLGECPGMGSGAPLAPTQKPGHQ